MKTRFLLLLLLSQISYAALPPQYQNLEDLQVMISYIEKNEEVISTLDSIDFESFTVHYSNRCKAIFGRKYTPKPEGWVGPADPLVFKSTSCNGEIK